MAVILFKLIWGGLLLIAILAQTFFKGKVKRRGSLLNNFFVAAPYGIVFGWFSVRGFCGSYVPIFFLQVLGLGMMLIGVLGYVVSILHLRHNWAVSVAVKENHSLVVNGPYKLVRHPMYFFMIITMLGSGFLVSNYLIIAYVPVVVALYALRANNEEALLKEALPGYAQYQQKVKMLIPGIF
jgi:protein-S-isoprenylcysteine O-methyltransferase